MNFYVEKRRRDYLVVESSFRRFGRGIADEAGVHRRAQLVNIRPRTLRSALCVQLDGRVAFFEHEKRLLYVLGINGRRAEVYQFDFFVVHYLNVFGRNVLVNDSVLVQPQQRFYNGSHDIERLGYVQSAAATLDKAVQAHTVQIFHDYVCGIVRQKEVVNGDYAVELFYGCEHFGFLNERRKPIIEHLAVFGVAELDHARMRNALGIALREKLLDGDGRARKHVVSFVRYAEPAATERRAHEISAGKQRPHGDRAYRRAVVGAFAATRTDPRPLFDRAETV